MSALEVVMAEDYSREEGQLDEPAHGKELWDSVHEQVQDIKDAIDVAISALETVACPDKQVSGITRKRLSVRAMERLERASTEAARFAGGIRALRDQNYRLQARYGELQEDRDSHVGKVTECRKQNMLLHEQMHELESVIQEHEQAAEAAAKKEEADVSYCATLQATIDSLNSELTELRERTQAAEAATDQMAKEHAARLEEMNDATMKGREACQRLESTEQRAQQATAAVETAHQAVAKLSADNVVLLVKLQKADARVSSLSDEVAELRQAVEAQSGAWFDDVHVAVERSIRDSMLQAQSLQARLEEQAVQHAQSLNEVAGERDKVTSHLAAALESCQQLEGDLQASRREAKELRVEVKRQSSELVGVIAARDEASAHARVIESDRAQMKREWSDMYAAHDSLVSRISLLEERLASAHAVAEEDKAQLAAAQNKVLMERSVNRQLLQSKADVEYRLMEALAHLPPPSPDVSRPGSVSCSPVPHTGIGAMPSASPRLPARSLDATVSGGNYAQLNRRGPSGPPPASVDPEGVCHSSSPSIANHEPGSVLPGVLEGGAHMDAHVHHASRGGIVGGERPALDVVRRSRDSPPGRGDVSVTHAQPHSPCSSPSARGRRLYGAPTGSGGEEAGGGHGSFFLNRSVSPGASDLSRSCAHPAVGKGAKGSPCMGAVDAADSGGHIEGQENVERN